MSNQRCLVFVSLEAWDDIWRRNQFICSEIASRHPDRQILFLTPPRDISNAVRTLKFAQLKQAPVWSPHDLPNIHVLKPTKWLPSTLAMGRAFNAIGLRKQLGRQLRQLRIAHPLLWINDHAAVHLVGQLGESSVVYDITDDWISFDQPPALRSRIQEQDRQLCQKANAVIVCSQKLHKLKQPLVAEERLHLIPNGVNVEHYTSVLDRTLTAAETTQAWPKPVFGYTGTIHADRVDVELVAAVARQLTSGCIALVGPDFLPPAKRKMLEATGRVVMTGPVPYAKIPDYMRAFDVCITPHRMTPFTESLNPIKLWEYLAAGKPIVSTDVAGFRDYPQYVRIARDKDSFVQAIYQALEESPELAFERQAEAAKHSWASRVDQIERVFEALKARS